MLNRPAFSPAAGPVILYDTSHWNPPLTEGRYQAVAELLRADGYRVVGGAVPFDAQGLGRYAVLFIVTPCAADVRTDKAGASKPVFSEAECDALAGWVRTGGTLLFVVGHEPSGIAHSNLARRFGVDLRNGSTNDTTVANNWIEGHAACTGCLKFTDQNNRLRPHPIVAGRDRAERVTSVISAVGSSLGVTSNDQIILGLGPAAYDVLADGTTQPAAGRAQGVARTFGSGRIVIIGDGSVLAGFAYGPESAGFRRWWPKDPDNTQFTLNVLHWLSGVLR